MQRWQHLSSLMLAGALLTTPLFADPVSVRQRPADYASYTTYAWEIPDKPRGPRVSPGGDLFDAIIEEADQAMASRGKQKVESAADADLLIAFDAFATPTLDLQGVRENLGSGVAWVVQGDGPISGMEGSLGIIVTERSSSETLWSGYVTKRLKDSGKLEKRVRKLTARIMARFPE